MDTPAYRFTYRPRPPHLYHCHVVMATASPLIMSSLSEELRPSTLDAVSLLRSTIMVTRRAGHLHTWIYTQLPRLIFSFRSSLKPLHGCSQASCSHTHPAQVLPRIHDASRRRAFWATLAVTYGISLRHNMLRNVPVQSANQHHLTAAATG